MLRFLKTHILFFIIIFCLVTRLINLTLQPIFCDEATYLDWGWRMVTSPLHFHSLYDAKQPFLMWIFGFSEKIFADPLFAGRLVSVITGLFTLLGLYQLSQYLFNKKIAVISCFLYPLIPLFFLYDRQALMESSIAAVGVWLIYFLFQFIDHPSLKNALLFGVLLALGFWIKSSSLLFIITDLVIYFVISLFRSPRVHRFNLLLYSLSLSVILLMPLFLQSQFWSLYLKYNSQYSLTLSELLRFPISHWWVSFTANLDVIFFQLTPIALLSLPGFYLSLHHQPRRNLILAAAFLFPLILETLSVKNPTARYLVSYLPVMCLYIALILSRIPWLNILIAFPLSLTLIQLFSPPDYFTFIKRFSNYSYYDPYVCCFATGYPVNQAVSYLKNLSQSGSLYVGVYLGVGNPPSAILSYFRQDPLVTPVYLDKQLTGHLFDDIDCLTSSRPVYFLAIQEQQAGLNKYFEYVTTFTNPYGKSDYLNLYTLKKSCTGKSFTLQFQ